MKNIKAVILAGGLGTRLSEETNRIPKPMVEIGNRPIIWHIMKSLSHYGIKEFVICCGYKGYIIKEYFSNYFLHNSDLTVNLEDNSIEILEKRAESWKIHLVDTGDETLTGGRMKRVILLPILFPVLIIGFWWNYRDWKRTSGKSPRKEIIKHLFNLRVLLSRSLVFIATKQK